MSDNQKRMVSFRIHADDFARAKAEAEKAMMPVGMWIRNVVLRALGKGA